MSNQGGLPLAVSDTRADRIEHVMHAVECLGKSEQKLAVYKAVYYHKQRTKSVSEIVDSTGLLRVRVLQIGNYLVQQKIMGQTVKDGETAYTQDPFYQVHKREILGYVGKPEKQEKVATKRRPRVTVTAKGNRPRARAPKPPEWVTIDSIDSFSKVRGIAPANAAGSMSEDQFKAGVQNIIGEKGRFKDWGGEQNDIYTTELIIRGRRRRAAFAFKGPGYKGMLRPNMGRNGDQVQRLFKSPADAFIVQHHTQIHESVIEQMETCARLRAGDTNADVFYGIIDGKDSNRLIAAYPKAFAAED
jgi:hypothetical protein